MSDYTLARKLISKHALPPRKRVQKAIPYRCENKKARFVRKPSIPVLTRAQEEKRFMNFVKRDLPTTDCWLWTGSTSLGYGIYRGKLAHHFLLETKPNENEMACHHCDNRNCVKPSHIYIGSAKTNAEDIYKKTNLNGKRRHENFLARSTLLE